MRKSIALAATAAVLLGAPVASATAQAPGTGHTAHSVHATKGHPSGGKPVKPPTHGKTHDKLAGPRKGASHAVAAQLKAVRSLEARTSSFAGTDAAALATVLAADEAAVRDDLGNVATATSIAALHRLEAAAGTTRQVAQTQVQAVVRADGFSAGAAGLDATVAELTTSLSDLAAAGTDTSAGTASLADATTQLGVANTTAGGLVQAALAVAPQASKTALRSFQSTVHTDLAAIGAAVDAASADIDAVRADYGL